MAIVPTDPPLYLAPTDLPQYAPSVVVPPQMAAALIQQASAAINARYDRTAEIVTITDEDVELSDFNIGHLATHPVQLTVQNGTAYLDASQGDRVLARYSRNVYPFAPFTPPAWETLDNTTVDVNPRTCVVMLPSGMLPVPYSEARITYRAGFCPVGGPYPTWLMQGCGRLIENWYQRSGSTVAKDIQVADQQHVVFFDNQMFDTQVEQFLAPMRKRMFY